MSENKGPASNSSSGSQASAGSSIHDTMKDTVNSVKGFVGEYTSELGVYNN